MHSAFKVKADGAPFSGSAVRWGEAVNAHRSSRVSLTGAVWNQRGIFTEKPLNMGNWAWGFLTADLDMDKERFKYAHSCKLHLSSQLSYYSPVFNPRRQQKRGEGYPISVWMV